MENSSSWDFVTVWKSNDLGAQAADKRELGGNIPTMGWAALVSDRSMEGDRLSSSPNTSCRATWYRSLKSVPNSVALKNWAWR